MSVMVVVSRARALSLVRLDKLIADSGAASSRTASAGLIRAGRVTVDGLVSRVAKLKVDALRVAVDGVPLCAPPPLLVAFHKPLGVHSTMSDDRGRADLSSVTAALPRGWRRALHPVGRLDADTSGLLLFSSSGELTHRLLHPRHGVEKEYVAECAVDEAKCCSPVELLREPFGFLAPRLAAGVETALGVHTAGLLHAEALGDQRDDCAQTPRVRVRLVVAEGKHRMVRRMLANLGAPVVHLRRERFGGVVLGDLAAGALRPVDDAAVVQWAEALVAQDRLPGGDDSEE